MSTLLDNYILVPDERLRHETLVQAPLDIVYDTALSFDLLTMPTDHSIFRLRSRLIQASNLPLRGFRGLGIEAPEPRWKILEERHGQICVVGAVCKPWLDDSEVVPVSAETFRSADNPGFVKIAWSLETQSRGSETTKLASELRFAAIDDQAKAELRRYWGRSNLGIRMVPYLLLRAVRHAAERSWHNSRTTPLHA